MKKARKNVEKNDDLVIVDENICVNEESDELISSSTMNDSEDDREEEKGMIVEEDAEEEEEEEEQTGVAGVGHKRSQHINQRFAGRNLYTAKCMSMCSERAGLEFEKIDYIFTHAMSTHSKNLSEQISNGVDVNKLERDELAPKQLLLGRVGTFKRQTDTRPQQQFIFSLANGFRIGRIHNNTKATWYSLEAYKMSLIMYNVQVCTMIQNELNMNEIEGAKKLWYLMEYGNNKSKIGMSKSEFNQFFYMDLNKRLKAEQRTGQLCDASKAERRKAAHSIFLKYCGMTSILARAYAGRNFGYAQLFNNHSEYFGKDPSIWDGEEMCQDIIKLKIVQNYMAALANTSSASDKEMNAVIKQVEKENRQPEGMSYQFKFNKSDDISKNIKDVYTGMKSRVDETINKFDDYIGTWNHENFPDPERMELAYEKIPEQKNSRDLIGVREYIAKRPVDNSKFEGLDVCRHDVVLMNGKTSTLSTCNLYYQHFVMLVQRKNGTKWNIEEVPSSTVVKRTCSNRLNGITPYLHDKKLYQASGNLYKIFQTDDGKREYGNAKEAYEALAQLTEKECGTLNFDYMDTKQEENSNQVCLEYGCAHGHENHGKECSNRDGETLWLPNYRLIQDRVRKTYTLEVLEQRVHSVTCLEMKRKRKNGVTTIDDDNMVLLQYRVIGWKKLMMRRRRLWILSTGSTILS